VAAAKKEALESVTKRAVDLASKAGFGGELHVVDEPPRKFEVGGRTWDEAGHYDPKDHSITINGRNVSEGFMPGLIAHEVMHHKWDTITAERDREHQEMHDMGNEAFDKMFRASGEPRDDMARAEMEQKWPVSALFAKTIGDGYLELGSDIAGMKIDDGVTDYSRAYWEPSEQSKQGSWWRGVNETLAEMAYLKQQGRLIESPRSGDIAQQQLEQMGYKVKRAVDGEPYLVNKDGGAAVYKAASKVARLVRSMKKSWRSGTQEYVLGGKVHPSSKWNQLFQGVNDQYARLMRKEHGTV
jgi:hypothetical protein